MCIYIYKYVCVCVFVYCMYACICVHACVDAYARTYIRTYCVCLYECMVCSGVLWYAVVMHGMLWYAMVCYGMLWHAMVQLDAQIFSRLRRFRQKNLNSERPVSSSFTTSKSASRVDVSSKRVTRRPGCRELLMKSAGTSKKQTEPKLAKGASSRSTGIHLNIFQTYHIYISIRSLTFRLERKIYFKVSW